MQGTVLLIPQLHKNTRLLQPNTNNDSLCRIFLQYYELSRFLPCKHSHNAFTLYRNEPVQFVWFIPLWGSANIFTPIVPYDIFHIPISRPMDHSPSGEARWSENLQPFMKFQSSQELTSWIAHPIFATCILTLLLHLCLGHQIGLFPWGFRTTILYAFLIIPMCASCPIYFILLDVITLII
jgi:hypothetical protein